MIRYSRVVPNAGSSQCSVPRNRPPRSAPRDAMEEAKAKGHLPTYCVVTHDIMSARRVADYINVMWKGRIVEAGPAEDMLNSDNPFIRQFLAGESEGPLAMD
jgi:phospholipid/cholesterol/gamma-HCH transport system ATP-binding protein